MFMAVIMATAAISKIFFIVFLSFFVKTRHGTPSVKCVSISNASLVWISHPNHLQKYEKEME
jgi:hypothetical protein